MYLIKIAFTNKAKGILNSIFLGRGGGVDVVTVHFLNLLGLKRIVRKSLPLKLKIKNFKPSSSEVLSFGVFQGKINVFVA